MLIQLQSLLILLLIVSICGLLNQIYGLLLVKRKVGNSTYTLSVKLASQC